MKNLTKSIFALLCLFFTCTTVSSQISGTAFKDFNFNGSQQSSGFPTEPGAFGITVKAFNSANVQVGPTKTTAVNGTYSFTVGEIPAGTAVRIEFTTASGVFNGKNGTANGTDVQFVTAPSATVNYAIASQDWYSNTANPYVATNGATNGDANTSGAGSPGVNNNLYIFPYTMRNGANTAADDGGATRRRPNSELGAIFGMAFQKTTRTLLMSAYLKRHTGFGPNGIGAIYKSTVDATGVPSAASLLVDVSAVGINVGTDPRTVALPTLSITRNADVGVFSEVGKRGIGGIDISEDGRDLFLVNMFEKKLHRINIGNPLKTSFTAADVTGNWTITDPATGGLVWHPMACKTANGKVYIGGVVVRETSTTHNLAADTVGARGIVYEFDPATGIFTEVLRYGLNYRRGFSNNDFRFPTKCTWWCGWQNNGNGGAGDPMQADYNTANGAFTGGIYYPQPMISNIEFDVDGSMILGIRDRFGDQTGYQNISNDGLPTGTGFGGANNYYRGLTSGEVLRAGKNLAGVAFTLENRGQSTNLGVTTGTLDAAAPGNPPVSGNWSPTASGTPWGGFFGPGWGGTAGTIPGGGPNPGTQGGYFYFNHNFTTTGTGTNGVGVATTLNGTAGAAVASHYMKSDGGLALLAGSNELIHNLMDPVTTSFANGVSRLINSGANAGTMCQRLDLVITTTGTPGNPTNSGKSNGLGDIEILTDYQPIEIGNRIWTDANGNGIQDAGAPEAGINGVIVELVSPGPNGIFGDGDDVVVATTTTATINGQSGSYFFSTLTVADARKPASFTGVGTNDILPGFDYRVRIPNVTGGSQQAALAGLQPTRLNTAANTFDNIDSDATLSGSFVFIAFNTSNSIHNFDIGFKPLASLGDKVWRDDDLDGIQNSGEPGVAGITVTLFDNLGNVAGTTVTDAYGFYLFDNLSAGTYQVGFTAPANYNFTTQTNNTDNSVLSGGSTAANGSDVNATTGRTANIVLSAGENERNIDAGLIFSQPADNSIGDRVWLDSDANGDQNGTEPGISGVTVTLFASDGVTIVATTVTDANGNYLFSGLPASTNYIVGLTLPAGMTYTSSGGTTTGNATINSDVSATTGKTTLINTGAAGNQITGIDAGLILTNNATASLGDKVWIDLPGGTANVQDAGEPGLAGVTVNLYRDANADGVINGAEATTAYATAVTNTFGNYIFNNLPALVAPGAVYQVRFVLPVGYTFVTLNIGTDDFKNSDADPTGLTKIYKLVQGQRNLSVDAGVTQNSPAGTARFGNRVWFDANSNGVQDAGESDVAGVTVTLYNSGGTAIGSTTTDANGYYQFINLAAATYSVGFSNLPSGYSFTNSTGTTSADATTNSDANPATGRTANFALLAAQSLQGLDCGLTAGLASGLGSIGNKVWYDLPGGTAGVQEAGELGVSGVTVTLLDAGVDGIVGNGDDGASRTTTTNALGEYIFTGLPAGNYAVQFSNLPGSYTITTSNAGIDDGLDSDGGAVGTGGAPAGASRTGVYNLAAGEDNLTVDLGLVPPANTNTLGNYVWFDRNNDGIQDANEQGIAGVMVTLYNNAGTAIALTTTNVNGEYLFTGLADGNYSTGFTNLPPGFDITTQSITNTTNGSDADRVSGRTATVTLNVGNRNDRTLDAGLISTRAALGNYVWMDSNGDGIQTAGEPAVPGVTVSLFRPGFGLDGIAGNGDDALPVASMITDQNGQYLFENLLPGTYQVSFTTIPTGILFTQQDAGGNDNVDSDVNPATGLTGNIVLAAGDINLTVDAGLFKPRAVIGNYIWADKNNNGIQDATEPGFAGVVVTLFNGATPVATAVTDANGGYLFPNVAPGTYSIVFSNLPTGVNFTTPDAGGNDNTDSDVIGTSITGIVVTTTTVNLSFDGGLNNARTLASAIEFTAYRKNTTAELNWKMGTDVTEVKDFVVERSANGTSYTAIVTVSATTASTYKQIDLQPNAGINYYRIKIINHTGVIKYSEVRVLNFNSKADITVFPNPVTDIINIQLPDNWQGKALSIDLISQAGQVVISSSTKQASQVERLTVNQLAAGIYLLRIQDSNNNVQTIKIKVN
jgi:SdrD B-like domain/Secretion system C-terminal sorting domain